MKLLLTSVLVCVACVSARAAIILTDNFAYPDSVLTNVSAQKWRVAGPVLGEVNVLFSHVELSRDETEDVNAALEGAPYSSSGGGVLYSRFTVTVSGLPTGANGGYFAHFNASSGRGRIFATPKGAASNRFRFGIGNASSAASTNWPVDLNIDQTYTIVTRLVVSNATATLWINPTAESDPSITGIDVASASSISSFSWRQDKDIGVLAVGELVVASSFGEALHGNTTPSIFNLPDQTMGAGASNSIPFVIGDVETTADFLTVSAWASDTNLVPGITFSGTDSNRTVTIATPPNVLGTSSVTVLVTDGFTTNSDSFVVTVLPALLFWEDFPYADGALITNGTPIWSHHGGATGEIQVVAGQIVLKTPQTEDVNITMPYGPFAPTAGVILYTSFRVNFLQEPGTGGDYFAHFNTNGTRCRLFANTVNALPEKFRLGIANASGGIPQPLAIDLSTNVNYLVVLRYNSATATSTLWVNPLSETAPGTNAVDLAAPNTISSFGFRQSSNIGLVTVDDLRIGLSFEAVTGFGAPRLRVANLTDGAIQLSWPVSAVGFILQIKTEFVDWQDLLLPPSVVGSENVVTDFPFDNPTFYRLRK